MYSIKNIVKNNVFMLSYIYRLRRNHIFVTFLVSFLNSISSILNLYITRYIINVIQIGNKSNVFDSTIKMILLLFAVNSIHTFVNSYFQHRVIPKNTQIICQQMQAELFSKASVLEMKHFDDPEFYNVFSMALQQSDARAQAVLNTINSFISSLVSISALIALIVVLEPVIVLLVAISVLISFSINTFIVKMQHCYAKDKIQPQREMEYSRYIFYRTENAKELRLFGNLKNMIADKHSNASNNIIGLINKYGKKISYCYCIQSISSNIATSSILIILAYKVINKLLLIGDFVTLMASSQQLSMYITGLLNTFPQMYEHSLYIDNFKEFIAYNPPANYCNGLQLTKINHINMKNVYFNYSFNKSETLKNINFEMHAGMKIAIVGENGAGKSTLIKLLTGLYEASKGEILINGNNINAYELNALQRCIGVVFQDYRIYALSIAENILMRKMNAGNEDENLVYEALKFVGLHEKINQLPAGIHTKITREFTNNGAVFSGGEVQKLALARAYASNCSMLILDEPSSSLDPISEYEMFNEMMYLAKKKCTIIISHRLKNIKNVDCIYVINNGEIIEYGNHDELFQKKGLYYSMYNNQTHEIMSLTNNS